MPDHDHDHPHDEFHDPTDSEIRAKAVESLLAEKGLLSTDAVDEIVDQYENDVGPMNGARVVARAWTDPEYKTPPTGKRRGRGCRAWATATSTAPASSS